MKSFVWGNHRRLKAKALTDGKVFANNSRGVIVANELVEVPSNDHIKATGPGRATCTLCNSRGFANTWKGRQIHLKGNLHQRKLAELRNAERSGEQGLSGASA